MRSSIEINDTLLRRAPKATGLSTKRAVVEEGLRLLIKVKGQASIRRVRVKMTLVDMLQTQEMENRVQ